MDLLARAYRRAGDLDKAREKLEKTTILTTGRQLNADLYAKSSNMLGEIAERQGNKARASENYRRFLTPCGDANPGTPVVEDARRRSVGLPGR
jgi:ATP/maltotriose-dependent transcriptional regulator MalT